MPPPEALSSEMEAISREGNRSKDERKIPLQPDGNFLHVYVQNQGLIEHAGAKGNVLIACSAKLSAQILAGTGLEHDPFNLNRIMLQVSLF